MRRGVDFAKIYATDLVYIPGCWQLCGNGNCCSFSRQKARFRLLGGQPAQELPLLPGEYEYLQRCDLLKQFGDHHHRVVNYAFGSRTMRIETIVSRRPGCACDHATRTTVCRLYPFLPVLDLDGGLKGIERLGLFEVIEALEGQERICQVESMPDGEAEKFMAITRVIASDPRALFYVGAYQIAQNHVRSRLIELRGNREADYLSIFEMALFRQRLVDHAALAVRLTSLAEGLEARHGPLGLDFALA